MHKNAALFGLKFNEKIKLPHEIHEDLDLEEYYCDNLCRSSRDEFFFGYTIKEYQPCNMYAVFQNIIRHICESLTLTEKQNYIKIYLKHKKKHKGKRDDLLMGQLGIFFWKPEPGCELESVVYSQDVRKEDSSQDFSQDGKGDSLTVCIVQPIPKSEQLSDDIDDIFHKRLEQLRKSKMYVHIYLFKLNCLKTLASNLIFLIRTNSHNSSKSNILIVGCKEPINIIVLVLLVIRECPYIQLTVVERRTQQAKALHVLVENFKLQNVVNVIEKDFNNFQNCEVPYQIAITFVISSGLKPFFAVKFIALCANSTQPIILAPMVLFGHAKAHLHAGQSIGLATSNLVIEISYAVQDISADDDDADNDDADNDDDDSSSSSSSSSSTSISNNETTDSHIPDNPRKSNRLIKNNNATSMKEVDDSSLSDGDDSDDPDDSENADDSENSESTEDEMNTEDEAFIAPEKKQNKKHEKKEEKCTDVEKPKNKKINKMRVDEPHPLSLRQLSFLYGVLNIKGSTDPGRLGKALINSAVLELQSLNFKRSGYFFMSMQHMARPQQFLGCKINSVVNGGLTINQNRVKKLPFFDMCESQGLNDSYICSELEFFDGLLNTMLNFMSLRNLLLERAKQFLKTCRIDVEVNEFNNKYLYSFIEPDEEVWTQTFDYYMECIEDVLLKKLLAAKVITKEKGKKKYLYEQPCPTKTEIDNELKTYSLSLVEELSIKGLEHSGKEIFDQVKTKTHCSSNSNNKVAAKSIASVSVVLQNLSSTAQFQNLSLAAIVGNCSLYGFKWANNSCALDSIMTTWMFVFCELFNDVECLLLSSSCQTDTLIGLLNQFKQSQTEATVAMIKKNVIETVCLPHLASCDASSCIEHVPLGVFCSISIALNGIVKNFNVSEDFYSLEHERKYSCPCCKNETTKKKYHDIILSSTKVDDPINSSLLNLKIKSYSCENCKSESNLLQLVHHKVTTYPVLLFSALPVSLTELRGNQYEGVDQTPIMLTFTHDCCHYSLVAIVYFIRDSHYVTILRKTDSMYYYYDGEVENGKMRQITEKDYDFLPKMNMFNELHIGVLTIYKKASEAHGCTDQDEVTVDNEAHGCTDQDEVTVDNEVWSCTPTVSIGLLEELPPLRKADKPVGLRNEGATCYVNVLYQILFHNLHMR
jgi:hypothetical protein